MPQLRFNPGLTLTGLRITRPWGPFLQRPGNLTGPESDFDIKVSRKVGCALTSDEVHFISLADNFTVQFYRNLLKLDLPLEWKPNSLTGPVITGSFEKRVSDHLTKNTEDSESNELTSQTSSFLTGSNEHVPTEIKTRIKACN